MGQILHTTTKGKKNTWNFHFHEGSVQKKSLQVPQGNFSYRVRCSKNWVRNFVWYFAYVTTPVVKWMIPHFIRYRPQNKMVLGTSGKLFRSREKHHQKGFFLLKNPFFQIPPTAARIAQVCWQYHGCNYKKVCHKPNISWKFRLFLSHFIEFTRFVIYQFNLLVLVKT